MLRRLFIVSLLFTSLCVLAQAQTPIGGIVNAYAAVIDIALDCQQILQLSQPLNLLTPGSRILVIQMKGASADSATGALTARGNAGTFEYATVAQASGLSLVLAAPLRYSYDVNAAVQVVVVPRYVSARVVSTLRPAPWNGTTGGVLALDVQETLRLEANVDATGSGFRGGRASLPFSTRCGNSALFVRHALGTSGQKGEGMSVQPPPFDGGRAPWAGGGGGGADTKGGGGGGGGAGAGGNGGFHVDTCGPSSTAHGLGGDAVEGPRSGIALVAGCGGGGAHRTGAFASDGASGGGIIVVRAATLQTNGFDILANGMHAANTIADGGGGGGGGGSILLEIGSITGNPLVSVAGGNGGAVEGTGGPLHGPGGGGGGGRIVYANQRAPSGVTNVLRGGRRGGNAVRPSASGDHGSEDGATGSLALHVVIPLEPALPRSLVASLPADTSVCRGLAIDIALGVAGGYPPYRVRLADAQGNILAMDVPSTNVIAARDTTLVLAVTDSVGCTSADTMRIFVANRAELIAQSVNMGTFVCQQYADTVVTFRNPSIDDVVIQSIDVQTTETTVTIPALPITVAPGSELRIPIRLMLPDIDGMASATIRVTSTACVPVVEATVTAQVARPRWSVPDTVQIPPHVRCAAPPGVVAVEIASSSSGEATVTADTAWVDAPFSITRSGARAWQVTWAPQDEGRADGVLTAVLQPCGDTVQIPVRAWSTQRALVLSGGGMLDVLAEEVDVVVENVGTAVATISQVGVSDANYTVTIVGGTLPYALMPGNQLRCTIGIASAAAASVATVAVQSLLPCDTIMLVDIARQRSVSARVIVGQAVAGPNERVDVPVSILDVRTNVAPLLQRWHVAVRFDQRSVVPIQVLPAEVDATWQNEGQHLVAYLDGPWNGQGVVATLTLQAMLANPPVTAILQDTTVMLWKDLPVDVVSNVEYGPGSLDLTGSICDRPLRAIAFGEIQGTLTVYDVLGREEKTLELGPRRQLGDVLEDVLPGRIGVLRAANGAVLWRGLLPPSIR